MGIVVILSTRLNFDNDNVLYDKLYFNSGFSSNKLVWIIDDKT